MFFKVSSNPCHSVILQFYDYGREKNILGMLVQNLIWDALSRNQMWEKGEVNVPCGRKNMGK